MSGVSPTCEEVAADLPGDGLVPGRCLRLDRAAMLPGRPADVWPWLVQLGKSRAGWYLPASLERLLPARGRGLRVLDPALQRVAIGDRVPDWGPGEPQFRAEVVDPPHALVWSSLRDRMNRHRWPLGDPGPADVLSDDVLVLSWALVLRANGSQQTRLQSRLRVRTRSRLAPVWRVGGGLVDRLTVALLVAGLRERSADVAQP